MINLQSLENGKLKYDPYENAFVDEFIPYDIMEELRVTFPKDNFRYFTRQKELDDFYTSKGFEDKHYVMCGRPLVRAGEQDIYLPENIPPIWREFGKDLLTDEYKVAMSKLTGLDLRNCAVQVDLWRYHPGCYTAPHTDDPCKSVSQILYFVKEWKPEWGGIGRMHDFSKEDHISIETLPSMTVSPVFIRSDVSYHSISQIEPDVPEARKVVDIVFYNTLPLPKRPGCVIGDILNPSSFID